MSFAETSLERGLAHMRFGQAVVEDDVATLNAIELKYPGFAGTSMYIRRVSDGGQSARLRMPMIIHAASGGHLRSLRWLVAREVDLQARCNVIQATALFHAVLHGEEEAVRILLAAGADPRDGKEANRLLPAKTPLECAREQGSVNIQAMLKTALAASVKPVPPPKFPQKKSGGRYKLKRPKP